MTKDETECISASKDGACIIWDIRNLSKLCRKQILNCTASLVWSLYHPSESQILTLATDSQLSYWEVFNAEEIRQLVLGRHSSLTALNISRDGEHFITATQDSLVKVNLLKNSDSNKIMVLRCGSNLEPWKMTQWPQNDHFLCSYSFFSGLIIY